MYIPGGGGWIVGTQRREFGIVASQYSNVYGWDFVGFTHAAGRRPAIGGIRIKDGPALVAVRADWTPGATTVEFDGLIEAGEDAWLWYAQTARDRGVVSVFCDPRRLRVNKQCGLQASYRGLLRQFRALKPEHLGEQRTGPQACDATSQHAEDPIGERYIRLGDSCFSVDPLSSQGVHLALQSGLQGAVIVNTILNKPENAEIAQRFFRTRTTQLINRYIGRTKQEYSLAAAVCSNAFWHERAGDFSIAGVEETYLALEPLPRASDQVVVSEHVTFEAAPVIDSAFVELRPVVRHPGIDGGVAYVDGLDLARLLSRLPARYSYGDILKVWEEHIPAETCGRIASWLWHRRVLVRAT